MLGPDVHYSDMEGTYHIVDVDIDGMSPMDMQIIMRFDAYPKGLLRMKVIHEEERVRLWYNVTSMVPLGDLLKRKKFSAHGICNLLLPLIALSDLLDSYLLDARNLRMEESSIYYDFKADCLMLMYLPMKNHNCININKMDLLGFVKDLVFKQISYAEDSSADASEILNLLGKLRTCDDLGALKSIVLNTTALNSSTQKDSNIKESYGTDIRIESGTFKRTEINMKNVTEDGNEGNVENSTKYISKKNPAEGVKGDVKGEIGIVIKRMIIFVVCLTFIAGGLKYLEKLDAVNLCIALSIAGLTPFVVIKSTSKGQTKSNGQTNNNGQTKNNGQVKSGGKSVKHEMEKGLKEDVTGNPMVSDENDPFLQRLKNERKSEMQAIPSRQPVVRPNETQLIRRSTGSTERIVLKPKDISRGMIEVTSKSCMIGRTPELSDYVLDCDTIGRLHAEIIFDDPGFIIKDFNTLNGTFVNHQRISPGETIKLNQGDTVGFADVEFIVS